MLFLIRLTTLFVTAAIAAVLFKWTEPFALRLGSYPALAFAALAVVFMWLTRTQDVKGSRISPNPLREIFVGAFGAMLWIGAMLLFFYVAANTTGLSEAMLDRDRREIEKVASLLEADGNWEAASKVYLDALQIPHTPGFKRNVAERAVVTLTRAAQLPRVANAVSLLEKATTVADEHSLPSDLPKAVLTRIRDKGSQAATEAQLSSALAANKGMAEKNQELAVAASKRESAIRTQLEGISKRAEKDKLETLRRLAETRLAVAGTMSKVARSLDLNAIRQHLAREISIAKKQGIDLRAADSVLSDLDSAILALEPTALPQGCTARVICIHPSPMGGMLLLDVEVAGAMRSPVLGLIRKDFVAMQEAQSLTVCSAPLSRSGRLVVAAVFDTSISTEGAAIEAARSSGVEFLNRLPAGTSLRVTSFSDRVKLLCDWSSDRARAIEACKSLRAEGGTALFAAVLEAIQALAKKPNSHLVVFSDGANMLPGPSKEDIIAAARRAKVKVHFVALKSAGYDDTSAIEAIAKGTSGETFLVTHSGDLVEKFRLLADKLNETGYRVAILDHDPTSPLELQIGGQNAIRLSVPSNSVPPPLATVEEL